MFRSSSLVITISDLAQKSLKEIRVGHRTNEATSLSLFRLALEAAVISRYGDWLRLFSQFKSIVLNKHDSLSLFDKKLVRWVETKGRTLGCEEKDRRVTMMNFHESGKGLTEMTRDELLFFYLDTLDSWSAKVGTLLQNDESAAASLRNDALSKLKMLEWADVKTIITIIERTQEDIQRLDEVEQSLMPRFAIPQFRR